MNDTARPLIPGRAQGSLSPDMKEDEESSQDFVDDHEVHGAIDEKDLLSDKPEPVEQSEKPCKTVRLDDDWSFIDDRIGHEASDSPASARLEREVDLTPEQMEELDPIRNLSNIDQIAANDRIASSHIT